MDFYQIKERSTKNGMIEVYPDFKVCRSKDLMVRGRAFYAIWNEEEKIWSTDEYDVQRLVDQKLLEHRDQLRAKTDGTVHAKLMGNFSSKAWAEFKSYMSHISDNAHQLDEQLAFSNSEMKKKEYVSKRLDYALMEGTVKAYDEIIGTLYEPEERAKLEWAIGAVVSGDARDIQKFIVLYGKAGAGKSTILKIIQKLFKGYYTTFEAKALTASSNTFSTEVFKSSPLVAIQHDGDLSKIEDNTKLNSIVSHEEMTMNEKYKPSYMSKINAFLFMATNKPVKITDAKSGIIRRLIDVKPSGKTIPTNHYHALMAQVDFELGAIAKYCLNVYRSMGKNYYQAYNPLEMIYQTDVFFNFVESNFPTLNAQEGVTLTQAYSMYKTYCDESMIEYKLQKHKFREELKNYYRTFSPMARIDGKQIRSYYQGFITEKFTSMAKEEVSKERPYSLVLDQTESLFDEHCEDCYAQYATDNETPISKWEKVTTILSNIDTTKIHYVKVPLNHIIIDFDIKDEQGNKSLKKNVEAASKWPATYAELSKGENGIHLHYIYVGDPKKLSRVYDEDIEIKVFVGKSSLRRKLTKCNNTKIAAINSGLPLKGEKMINFESVKNERILRNLISQNLKKEVHAGTKPSVDFIHKILDDAYKSDLNYDVSDMSPRILAFANNSSHQAATCLKTVSTMKFKSEEISSEVIINKGDETIAFFDVEVFPNLFIVCWKFRGKDKELVKMINPTASEIEQVLKLMLVGFNCRRYDNHIMYAAYIGYSIDQLYILSKRIIDNSRNGTFAEAYGLSYTDIYDFSSKKQSLKKFQIELGIHHLELGLPWDEPVPKELWKKVADYCGNDVLSTEAVFEDRYPDFVARQILAELSGLTVNDTTQKHTGKIIFGNNKKPQSKFEYTDLSKLFPGYKFNFGKSEYRGEITGEGGYVYAEPGMYGNVALLDVESMHPNSAINMNVFGIYTKNYEELIAARMLIKHKKYDEAKKILDGILAKHLTTEEKSAELSHALKIGLNIVYGLTSAKFDNLFKDPRNIDNIVAKRGALFMVDLKHAVKEQGFEVAHIKTDSIKIPDATPEIINFVIEFGKKYGYDFEHEATYDKFCLVNDAVYIAKKAKTNEWIATGAQFAQPYVYKKLFSGEEIEFKDMCLTKTVTTALHLDMNETLGEDEHNYHFVGKAGSFCPIKPGHGGGMLMRTKEDNYYAANGTKGYRWLEAELVEKLNKQGDIDRTYFDDLAHKAIESISKYGDFTWFTSDEPYEVIKDNEGFTKIEDDDDMPF